MKVYALRHKKTKDIQRNRDGHYFNTKGGARSYLKAQQRYWYFKEDEIKNYEIVTYKLVETDEVEDAAKA